MERKLLTSVGYEEVKEGVYRKTPSPTRRILIGYTEPEVDAWDVFINVLDCKSLMDAVKIALRMDPDEVDIQQYDYDPYAWQCALEKAINSGKPLKFTT